MIKLHEVNKNTIQIYGSHNNITVNGVANKVDINSERRVWQYNVSLLAPPKIINLKSNPKEATMSTKESLLTRLVEECENI